MTSFVNVFGKAHLVMEVVRCCEEWNEVVNFAKVTDDLWELVMKSEELQKVREEIYFGNIRGMITSDLEKNNTEYRKRLVETKGWNHLYQERAPVSTKIHSMSKKENQNNFRKGKFIYEFYLTWPYNYSPKEQGDKYDIDVLLAFYLPKADFNSIELEIGGQTFCRINRSQVRVLQKFYEMEAEVIPFGLLRNSILFKPFYQDIRVIVMSDSDNLELWASLDHMFVDRLTYHSYFEKNLEYTMCENSSIQKIENGVGRTKFMDQLHETNLFIKGGKIKSVGLKQDHFLEPLSIENYCDGWTFVRLSRKKWIDHGDDPDDLSWGLFEYANVDWDESEGSVEVFNITQNIIIFGSGCIGIMFS